MSTTTSAVGRARLIPSRREGLSAREEILEAAAQLFSENGYAATSTRSIALAVGIKQASLYYHFACKEDILAGLLAGTVEPSLAFATRIARSGHSAQVQLYALAHFDVTLLAGGSSNAGALYQLPELRAERFAEFRRDRNRLRDAYGRRIAAGIRTGVFTQATSLRVATELVFAFAESVISIRSNSALDTTDLAPTVSEGCLRLLSCSEPLIAEAGRQAAGLLTTG
ncbi:TetR/AcrR family transcriptional regulator [Jatrophihabitans sp. DSM 45814]